MTEVTPTAGIVEAAHSAYMAEPRIRGLGSSEKLIAAVVTAALNHPDTATLFDIGNNSTPTWEPLYLNDPLSHGDRVRKVEVENGVSYIEEGVVGGINRDGDIWTSKNYHLGTRGVDSMYILRDPAKSTPAHPDLPIQDGAVIVKKSDRILARHAGKTWATSEAVLVVGEWRGTWLEEGCASDQRGVMWAMSPERITPNTWKVDRK